MYVVEDALLRISCTPEDPHYAPVTVVIIFHDSCLGDLLLKEMMVLCTALSHTCVDFELHST